MKRRFGEIVKETGFCIGQVFHPVDPSDFEYFEACDTSVVLCNSPHEKIKNDFFVHQLLPDCMKGIDLELFCKFANNCKLPDDADPNFQDWFQLLAFLKASSILDNRLAGVANLEFGPIAALTAFRQFGVLCSFPTKVPALESNIDFFHAHKTNVLIEFQRDRDIKLCIPEEVIELLDPSHTILVGCFISPNEA